jgi:hypothetical protein
MASPRRACCQAKPAAIHGEHHAAASDGNAATRGAGYSLLAGSGRSSKAAESRRGALASHSATSGIACIRDTAGRPRSYC